MVVNFLLLLLMALVLAVAVRLVGHRLSRFPRSAMDVTTFLRGGHPKRMMELLNPEFEEGLRQALPRREFLLQQRKSLRYALEFMQCWAHDATVMREWADRVTRREAKERPGEPDAPLFVDGAKKLHVAAVNSRVFAVGATIRIRFQIVFQTQWWLPFPVAEVYRLSHARGLDFFACYKSFIQAVSDLALLHGEEFQEAFMNALVRPDPLDVGSSS